MVVDVLHEKAFRKQGAVSLVGKVGRNKGRWYRNVGLGIKVSARISLPLGFSEFATRLS